MVVRHSTIQLDYGTLFKLSWRQPGERSGPRGLLITYSPSGAPPLRRRRILRRPKAEGQRNAESLSAEANKAAAVLEAEGRWEEPLRDAEARERTVQAEADDTRMVSKAVAAVDVQALN